MPHIWLDALLVLFFLLNQFQALGKAFGFALPNLKPAPPRYHLPVAYHDLHAVAVVKTVAYLLQIIADKDVPDLTNLGRHYRQAIFFYLVAVVYAAQNYSEAPEPMHY